MSVRKSAPAGYESAYAAMLDLIRWGFAIWGSTKMAVLLYHVERTAAWGKNSEQHSQSQAAAGIYSHKLSSWIRGAAGVSLATWKRENAALQQAGILKRERRKRWNTGHDATEYTVDWLAVRAAITEHQASLETPDLLPLFAHSTSEDEVTPWLTLSQGLGSPRAKGLAHSEPHNSSYSSVVRKGSVVSESPDTGGAAAIRDSLTAAYGAELPSDDPIPGQLLELSRRMRLPDEALLIWIAEFAADKRRKGYPITSPQLFLTAAPKALKIWERNNGPLLARIATAAAPASRPAAPPLEMRPCAHCGAVTCHTRNGQPCCIDCWERPEESPIDNPAKIEKKSAKRRA